MTGDSELAVSFSGLRLTPTASTNTMSGGFAGNASSAILNEAVTTRFPARYPPPPPTSANDPHTSTLGWKINSPKIRSLYRRVLPSRGRGINRMGTVLGEIAKFPYVVSMRALLDDAPWPAPDVNHYDLPNQVVCCITFTRRGWYERRPLQQHYATLTRIVGEPTWFRDILPKNQWRDHFPEF